MVESNSPNSIDYTIVVPVYYNEGLLATTLEMIKENVIARNSDLQGEVIFVDDGSGDKSFEELVQIFEQNRSFVKVIKLTRNFGQVHALMAGFRFARGKCAIAISADGQDPVEFINKMLDAHFKENYEIVICTRQGRDESYYRILTSRIFYSIMRKIAFPNMPTGGFDFILIGRRALGHLLALQETHPFFQGQILSLGFRTKFIEYYRVERKIGKSRWTFGKKLTYLLDGVLNYSFLPIRMMSGIGIIVALLGFAYAVVIFVLKLIGDVPVTGWAPLMIVILIIGGVQILLLGIIGEYIWRILAQIRNRPLYIIDEIYDNQPPDPGEFSEEILFQR